MLMAVFLSFQIVWDMTLYGWARDLSTFAATFLRNIRNHTPNDTAA